MSDRLEEIKEVIANELGLTDDWMDGTYLYCLTRAKSAFSVGTMTLDDFEEIDEELLEGFLNAIKPFIYEYEKRVEELESLSLSLGSKNKRYKKTMKLILDYNHIERTVPREIIKMIEEALEGSK